MKVTFIKPVSDERAAYVIDEIKIGSAPEIRFYAMVAASTIIATFGLIQNSTATVIGAMLVAPLMTPIFGIMLALIRGDTQLLGQAAKAEVIGVLVTMAFAFCFGILIPELEVTEEMLSRTKPNLLDLLVAVFAGFAGAYALIDEHISPALPGVAIATAIVPPLSNSGLCIALGAYNGALGSFLLFFANFLSILLISTVVFIASGMAREFGSVKSKDLFRKFSLAVIGFLVIGAFFSKGLYETIKARHLKISIEATLAAELSHLPATELRKMVYQKDKDKLYILAHILASGNITPSRVKSMEVALESELKIPVELFVRSTPSNDISATGSINQVLTETLDGFFVSHESNPRIVLKKAAEQTIREYLDTQPALDLRDMHLMPLYGKELIVASVLGAADMSAKQVRNLELKLRERTGNDNMILLIRHIDVKLYNRFGKKYLGWLMLEDITPEQMKAIEKMEEFLSNTFDRGEYYLVNTDFSIRDGIYHVLIELTGPELYSQEKLVELRQKLVKIAGDQLEVYVRSKPEVVLTQSGLTSFAELQDKFSRQFKDQYKQELAKIIEESL